MFREWKIRQTLRALSRQRVAMILQPGGGWVIEKAIEFDDTTRADLATCQLRGWVDVLYERMPSGSVQSVLAGHPISLDKSETIYRLTDSGWAVINRDFTLTLVGVFLTLTSLILGMR